MEPTGPAAKALSEATPPGDHGSWFLLVYSLFYFVDIGGFLGFIGCAFYFINIFINPAAVICLFLFVCDNIW